MSRFYMLLLFFIITPVVFADKGPVHLEKDLVPKMTIMAATSQSNCLGDVNGDNRVDLTDLGIINGNLNMSPAAYGEGDLNGDNIVDANDLTIVNDNFGNICLEAEPEDWQPVRRTYKIPVDASVVQTVEALDPTVVLTVDVRRTDAEYVELLKPLPALRKPHYSWPVPERIVNDSPELLTEFIRITGGYSIRGESTSRSHLEAVAPFLQNGGKLGINWSPLHRKVPKANVIGNDVLGNLDKIQEDLDFFVSRMTDMQQWCTDLNITVGVIILDSERFRVDASIEGHNAALTDAYNSFYDSCKTLFPNVPVSWYGRGSQFRAANDSGWSQNKHLNLDERGDGYSTSLYQGPRNFEHQEKFRRTYNLAVQNGETEVHPWVSLGSGYHPSEKEFHRWTMNWDYSLEAAFDLGFNIDHPWPATRPERFAPWNGATIILFYPEPFGRTDKWGEYFVAYVRGAHLIKNLDDLTRGSLGS